MTIADKITTLDGIKQDIKAAIEAKGVTVGAAPFGDYDTKISEITGGGGGFTPTAWVRPADWLAMPPVSPTENKVVILTAVFDSPTNNVILAIDTIAYTVDWGDGTIENITAGQNAQHNYNYNNAALNGTLCSRGYKQAIITMTPTVGGQNIGVVRFQLRYTGDPTTNYSTPFLDVTISAPNATYLSFGGASTAYNQMVERIRILSCKLNDMYGMFQNCYGVQVVELPFACRLNSASATNYTFMFANCYALISAPLFDMSGTAGVVSMQNMFVSCSSLQTLPFYNTTAVGNMSAAFNGCLSLVEVPLFDTQNVTDMANMFSGCYALRTVPLFNTIKVTTFSGMFRNCATLISVPAFTFGPVIAGGASNMFNGCSMLQEVGLFDTARVQLFSGMFQGCKSLTTVPAFDTSNGVAFDSMFRDCFDLKAVPLFNTAKATTFNYMFYNCYSLVSIPSFNTPLCTNFANAFNNCFSIQTVGAITTTAVTSSSGFSSMFTNSRTLTRIQAAQFKYTFGVNNLRLSAAALDEIYTKLPTVTGQTITVTGNPGVTSDNPAIATAKGWTVTG